MDERFAHYEPHIRKAWASVHLELTRVAKEKRILRQRSPQTKRLLEDTIKFHPKPRGRAPTGKSWDPIYGEWTDTSPKKVKQKTKANKNKATAADSFMSTTASSDRNKTTTTTTTITNEKGKRRQQPKGKVTKHINNEKVTKRQTRSAAKPKNKIALRATHSPLIDPTQQRPATKIVTASSSTNICVSMPSPKRLEATLEENLGGFLALAATPPRHTTTNRPKTATSPIPKLLLTSKVDALATMWGAPRKSMSPLSQKKTEKRRASDSNNRVAHHKESGGMLAEISNQTRKRKSSTEQRPVAKKPRVAQDDIPSVVIREAKQPLVQKQDGTFTRPRGKPPKGFDWDEQGGAWVSKIDRADKQRWPAAAPNSKESVTTRADKPKETEAKAKDSTRPSAKVLKNTAKQPLPLSKARNDVAKQTQIQVSHSTTDERYQRTTQNSPSKSKGGTRQAKQTVLQRNRNSTEEMLQRSIQHSPRKVKDRHQNSPRTSKDHHRPQHTVNTQGDSPDKKTPRKIEPTDSLYSPAKSEFSMQKKSATSSRLSPRGQLKWDSSKDDTESLLHSPPEYLSPRKRKEPDHVDRPLQSVLKQPRLAQVHFDTATSSMLASPANHSSPRSNFHHVTGGTPDGSRGSHRSRSRTQTIFARPHRSDSSRKQRLSMQFAVHAPTYTAQPMPTESRDYVACGDCLNCRLPINCGACLLCKNSLHFGSLFPSCVRRICVSPVLPPLQRVAMVQFSATKRPSTSVGSPPRRSPKKLIGSGNGLLGSFGKYRDKDENSMDESEPAPSKASVQTDDNTDMVESLHPDSDDDISDF
jgi:hypothetical protein